MPILIGTWHTQVHFADLVSEPAQEAITNSIIIMGETKSLYNTFGLVSFMMGISFIIIGLLNIAAIKRNKGNYPPILNIIIMMLYLACVIYVGRTFDATEQFYGGIVGMFLSLFCLGLTLTGNKKV